MKKIYLISIATFCVLFFGTLPFISAATATHDVSPYTTTNPEYTANVQNITDDAYANSEACQENTTAKDSPECVNDITEAIHVAYPDDPTGGTGTPPAPYGASLVDPNDPVSGWYVFDSEAEAIHFNETGQCLDDTTGESIDCAVGYYDPYWAD